MRSFVRPFVCCALMLGLFSLSAAAQDPAQAQKEAEEKLFESVDREVERLTNLLDLDDAQIFYVDSILTHDLKAVQDDFAALARQKVTNMDIYEDARLRWMDKIYYAYEKVFNEEQWAKYLKTGAARDKKNRDKRLSKSQK